MLNGAQPRLSDGGKQQAGRRCFFVFTTISCLTSRVNSNKPPKPASSSTWWGEWGDIWTTLNGPRRNSIDHRPWCFHQVLNGESVWIIERERERERERGRERESMYGVIVESKFWDVCLRVCLRLRLDECETEREVNRECVWVGF